MSVTRVRWEGVCGIAMLAWKHPEIGNRLFAPPPRHGKRRRCIKVGGVVGLESSGDSVLTLLPPSSQVLSPGTALHLHITASRFFEKPISESSSTRGTRR